MDLERRHPLDSYTTTPMRATASCLATRALRIAESTAAADAAGGPAGVRTAAPQSLLCEPSQSGGLAVCLQPHSHTFPASGNVQRTGVMPVP